MVDISAKPISRREARARGAVKMSLAAFEAIVAGNLPKGEVIATARIAGIQAAKRTSELIPMCHPLALTVIDIDCVPDRDLPGIRIEARVRCEGKTGAEMEALTAVAVVWTRSWNALSCLASASGTPGAWSSDRATSSFSWASG